MRINNIQIPRQVEVTQSQIPTQSTLVTKYHLTHR